MADDTATPAGRDEEPRRPGRRRMLRDVGAAGAGLAAGILSAGSPAQAATSSPVLLGKANSTTATTSVTTTKGDGLQGTAKANKASGVSGVDASIGGGYGVQGTSSVGTGVYGSSTVGTGVHGTTKATGNNGVFGADTSTGGGTGVYGVSSAGTGVSGTSTSGGTALEVSGSGTVYGDLDVTGTLTKGGGAFKIDHPLDPADKYLYHSFVESPDMKNVYDGLVTLDQRGRATVTLPDWFEALNRDFRYQLTPVGAPAPDLHVAAGVSGGEFTIAGGAAGLEVSWLVTGIRQDRWADAHRIPVVQDKPAADRGRYLHPALYDGEPVSSLVYPAPARGRHPLPRSRAL